MLENTVTSLNLDFQLKAVSDYWNLAELRDEVDKACTLLLDSLLDDPALKSCFTINGLYYLRLIREELGQSFIDLIKRILIIERIVSIEKPSRIIVFEKRAFSSETLASSLGAVVKTIGQKHSIRVSVSRSVFSPLIFRMKLILTPLYFSLYSPLTKYYLWKAKFWFRSGHSEGIPQHVSGTTRKAVFIPFTDAERVYLEPVLGKLCEVEAFDCLAVQYPADLRHVSYSYGKQRFRGYPFFRYYPRGSKLAKTQNEEVSRAWGKNKRLFFACPALNVAEVSLADLTRKMIDLDVKYWFRECVNYYVTTKEFVRVEQPSCIVVSKERELFMRTVLAGLRQERVPSIVVQHGIYYDSWLWDPIDATKLCVDEVFREILIKRGEDPEKIEVTGSPVYDKILGKLNEEKSIIRERIGLVQGRIYLCFLTSILPEWSSDGSRLSLLRSLIQAVKRLNCDLLIRLHPRESKQELNCLIAGIAEPEGLSRIHVMSFEDADLFDVILASDIVVGVRTSALIVALLAKKPSILVSFDRSVTDFFLGIEGNIFGVARSTEQFLDLIEDMKVNEIKVKESVEKGQRYARRYVPYENATDRVVNCILRLLA